MIKLVNAGLQPVFQAGLRSACAFLPVLAFALLARRRLSLTDGSLWPGVLCGCFFATEFLLLFQSVEYTSVARVSVFFYTMPFWVALGAHFLIPGERLTRVRALGLALAVAGVALALLRNDSPAGPHALFGDLLSLVGAMFWAGIVFMARMTKLSRSSPEMLLLYQLAVSAPILLVVAPGFGPLIREMTPALAGIFAFQVIAVVCVGFVAWFWVLKIYPASDMASFSFLAPVFGVLFSWLILGEDISWSVIAALVLVAAGIYLVNRRPRGGG
jgi:drug/metabolite transporter (DMT)-like permease